MSGSTEIEDIIKTLSTVKQREGKITQDILSKYDGISSNQVYNHFDSLEIAKLEVNLYESDYINLDPKVREDYEPVLLQLLQECEKHNGKVTRKLIGQDDDMPKISDYKREFETLTNAKIKAELGSDNVIQFTEEQLAEREDEMIELFRTCKEKHGRVNRTLIRDMDSYLGVEHIKRHFGSIRDAKREALDNPDLGGVPLKEYSRKEVLACIEKCEEDHGEVKRDILHSQYLPRSQLEKHFDSLSKAKKVADINNLGRICLTQAERDEMNKIVREDKIVNEVIKGLLLGDGSIARGGTEACLRVGMANKEFLEWLEENYLEPISAGITHKRTPEVGARKARETGFRPNASAENYSDIYELRTFRLESITEIREKWYPDGKKQFPEDLELTPLSAKIWYCGDGGLNISYNTCAITNKSQSNQSKLLEDVFEEVGIDGKYRNNKRIVFCKKDSKHLLNWMGYAPRGFEYKWELENEETYRRLKNRVN